MFSKSSNWELGFVHYIMKFTILRFVISRLECTYSARYFLWVWVPGSTLLLGNLFPGLRSRGFCPGLFRNRFTLLLLGLVLKSPLLFGPGNGCLRLEKLNLFPILSKKLWNSFCGFSDGKNDVSPDTFGGIFTGGEVGSGST